MPAHVVLHVKDLERMRSFCARGLGWAGRKSDAVRAGWDAVKADLERRWPR